MEAPPGRDSDSLGGTGPTSSSHRFLDARFLSAGSASLLTKAATAGSTFLLTVSLSRALGPAEFGRYSLAISVAALGVVCAGAGLPAVLTREVAACRAHAAWHRLASVMRATVLATIVSSGLAALAVGAILSLQGDLGPIAAICAAVLVPITALNLLRGAFVRGLGHAALAEIPDYVLQPALVTAACLLSMFATMEPDAADVIVWHVAAALVAGVLGIAQIRCMRPPTSGGNVAPARWKTWRHDLWASFALSIAFLLEQQVGVYVLNWAASSSEVAHFQSARQLVALISAGLTAVNLPLQSRIAAAWAVQDIAEAQRVTTHATLLGCSVAVVGLVAIVAAPAWALSIYGPGYEEAAASLRILAIGQFVNAVTGPCGLVLLMTGHQRQALACVAAGLFVNMALGVTLAPTFGTAGAATAASIGSALSNLALAWVAFRRTGIVTPVWATRIRHKQANR